MGKQEYDRQSDLKAFDETKAGVKGLIDAGITKIPRIFVHNQAQPNQKPSPKQSISSFPSIDFKNIDIDASLRSRVIEQVRDACENWGFFRVVNHGVPENVMDEMIDGVQGYYNYKAPAANRRDTIFRTMAPECLQPQEMPEVCRYL
ncbi:Deacetoxyvindoline 4-hydroxylase [Heracleum sosnowskyi]|uniref:Deacetoxyvindoline 4-hydroxylase n=1 Tax=Heracleum sosnowskyi TaxID=360622 RepID=A0AAD8I751_9APIA|nr:Deacetoxyvindoline 4-hydroxylase [Heracleum sosnowskyi]